MNVSEKWFTALVLVAGMGLGSAAGQTAFPSPESGTEITVTDVLDRVERYARMKPDNAGLWQEGLQNMNHPLAEVELALMEIYGPHGIRDPDGGLARLNTLMNQDHDALPAETRRLLRVLADQAGDRIELERRRERLAESLDRERRAHLKTLEKLEALRQIERQLETQQEADPAPAVED